MRQEEQQEQTGHSRPQIHTAVSPNNQVPTAKPGPRHFMGKSLKWNLPEPHRDKELTREHAQRGQVPSQLSSPTHPPTPPHPGCQSRRALRKDTGMHPHPKMYVEQTQAKHPKFISKESAPS